MVVCAAALLFMCAVQVGTLSHKSLTTDEYVHIPAAVAHLHGDFRPNAEHPPLAKLIAALPLIVIGVTPPPVAPAETPTKQLADAARYFWRANAEQFAAISYWARIPMIAVTAALGLLIFAFARSHFGDLAAALAVVLFALEPTFLAHGRVVHTDVAAAIGLLGSAAASSWYFRRQTTLRAALLGLVVGLTLVTKFSMLALAPVLLLLWGVLAWRAGSRARVAFHAATSGLVALVAIHACYGFRRQPLDPAERAWAAAQVGDVGAAFLRGLDTLGWLLPPRFVFGAFQQYLHNRDGHPAALLGEYALHGWWYYFPVAFALKTPLPLLALCLGAVGWALWRGIVERDGRILWLVGPLACYLAIALTSRINIGIRHLLPLYPFLLILAGDMLSRLWRATTLRALPRLTVVAIVGWLVVETLLTYPNYGTYMNQIARGQPGWSLLSDSNVEWGDDLGALARYLQARGETTVQGAVLGGSDLLAYHGIDYTDLFDGARRDQAPESRYIAIGASYLNGSTVPLANGHFRPDYFAHYRWREPEAVLGGSIYLFRNEPQPVELAAPLPDSAFRASLRLRHVPPTLRAGQTTLISVTIRNDSGVSWPLAPEGHVLNQIRLGNYWLDAAESLAADDARAPLPLTLDPGERARLHLLITAPAAPGEYWLGVDLVQEGVAWFGARGSAPARVKIVVVP